MATKTTVAVQANERTYLVEVYVVEPGVKAVELDGTVIAYLTRAPGLNVRVERVGNGWDRRTLVSMPLALRWAVIGAIA